MYANAPYMVIQRTMHIHPTQQICFFNSALACQAVLSSRSFSEG
jgi:hypothetical protein